MNIKKGMWVLLCCLIGFGCASNDHMYFGTNTSIGVDVSSIPSNVSVGYERQEIIMSPSFKDGIVPSALATIDTQLLGFKVNQTYSTGHASKLFAQGMGTDDDSDAEAEVIEDRADTIDDRDVEDEDRPQYAFATNLSFGLRLKFPSGTDPTGASASIAFKRQEVSAIPVVSENSGSNPEVPSLFATVGIGAKNFSSLNPDDPHDTSVRQIFATGAAAELLARRKETREPVEKAFFDGATVKELSNLGTKAQREIDSAFDDLNSRSPAEQDSLSDTIAETISGPFQVDYVSKQAAISNPSALTAAKNVWLSDEVAAGGDGPRHRSLLEAMRQALK